MKEMITHCPADAFMEAAGCKEALGEAQAAGTGSAPCAAAAGGGGSGPYSQPSSSSSGPQQQRPADSSTSSITQQDQEHQQQQAGASGLSSALSDDLPSDDGELPDVVSQEAEGAQQISGLIATTGKTAGNLGPRIKTCEKLIGDMWDLVGRCSSRVWQQAV